jgi:hypothetical protein
MCVRPDPLCEHDEVPKSVVQQFIEIVNAHRADLTAAGVTSSFSLTDGQPESLRFDADSSRALAQAVLYASGEVSLVIGDATTGAVLLDESRQVTSEIGLSDLLATVLERLRTT